MNVAHTTNARPSAERTSIGRQYSHSVVDARASLGEEIRRQAAWIALAARQVDQGADPTCIVRDLEEAFAWLMTISLEVDEIEPEEICTSVVSSAMRDESETLDHAAEE